MQYRPVAIAVGIVLILQAVSQPVVVSPFVTQIVVAPVAVLARNSVPMTVLLLPLAVFQAPRFERPVLLRQTLLPVLPVPQLDSVIFGIDFLFRL